MDARLADLWRRYQRKVTLIGWSLGGVVAREMARRSPDLVGQVITLGSPFADELKAGRAGGLAEIPSKHRVDDWPHSEITKLLPPGENGDLQLYRGNCCLEKALSMRALPNGSAGAQQLAEGPARTHAGESRQCAEIAAEVALLGRKER
jgi:pimeloyl-ACP methyl ester carboxylesterase